MSLRQSAMYMSILDAYVQDAWVSCLDPLEISFNLGIILILNSGGSGLNL